MPTYTNNDGAVEGAWRNHRLAMAHGYARGRFAALSTGLDLDELVVNLHDHKGMLTVTWRITPTYEMKALYEAAWDDMDEDGGSAEQVVDLKAPAVTKEIA